MMMSLPVLLRGVSVNADMLHQIVAHVIEISMDPTVRMVSVSN